MSANPSQDCWKISYGLVEVVSCGHAFFTKMVLIPSPSHDPASKCSFLISFILISSDAFLGFDYRSASLKLNHVFLDRKREQMCVTVDEPWEHEPALCIIISFSCVSIQRRFLNAA